MSLSNSSTILADLYATFLDAWSSRRVWWFTATARTRARFARTLLGSFWLGLSNLLSIAVLAIVYGTVFKVEDYTAYVVYLGVGLTLWNSLASAISAAPNLFEHNAQHVHNTNLNPVFYTLEEWSFQLQTFLQSFFLVLSVLSFFQSSLIVHLFSAAVLPLFNYIVFIYWFPVLLCLLGARYRDVYQLVPIVLQLIFLLSPILYERKNLGFLAWTADVNPLYQIMHPLREGLLHGTSNPLFSVILLSCNFIGLLTSTWLVNRERRHLPFLI